MTRAARGPVLLVGSFRSIFTILQQLVQIYICYCEVPCFSVTLDTPSRLSGSHVCDTLTLKRTKAFPWPAAVISIFMLRCARKGCSILTRSSATAYLGLLVLAGSYTHRVLRWLCWQVKIRS